MSLTRGMIFGWVIDLDISGEAARDLCQEVPSRGPGAEPVQSKTARISRIGDGPPPRYEYLVQTAA